MSVAVLRPASASAIRSESAIESQTEVLQLPLMESLLDSAAIPPAESSSSAVASGAPAKRAYPAAAATPTQEGPTGLRFDFNEGCRVVLSDSEHPWHVRLSDLDTGNILFDTELKAGHVNSSKRYFVRFRVEAWQNGESVFAHDYSAADRDVLIQFPVGTLGDTLGWFPYAVKFQERHKCRLTCAMAERTSAFGCR